MDNARTHLRETLKKILPTEARSNLYFDPPSSINLKYPCVIYHEIHEDVFYAGGTRYVAFTTFRLTVIEKNPDRELAKSIVKQLPYGRIVEHLTTQGLRHTIIQTKW